MKNERGLPAVTLEALSCSFDPQVFDTTVATPDGEVLFKGTDVVFRKAGGFAGLGHKIAGSISGNRPHTAFLLKCIFPGLSHESFQNQGP